jgi:hypothetical protein
MTEIAEICPRCAYDHRIPRSGKASCSEHQATRRDKAGGLKPCLNSPLVGLKHCRFHGEDGAAVRAKGKAERRRDQMNEKIKRTANVFGLPREIDPANGLVEEYWRTAGLVSQLEELVSRIPEDEIHWGRAKETVKVTGGATFVLGLGRDPETSEVNVTDVGTGPAVERTTVYEPLTNAWVLQLERERDRFAKLGIEIVKLGLEARRDAYIRAQVDVFASVILDPTIGLSEAQRKAIAGKLRALAGKSIEGQVVEA